MLATDSMTWAQALLHSGPETRVHHEGRVAAYIHLFQVELDVFIEKTNTMCTRLAFEKA